ncbi:MAG: metalloprotease PmbA [Pseudomonadota bacterium]
MKEEKKHSDSPSEGKDAWSVDQLDRLHEIAQQVLAGAKAAGADGAEVSASNYLGISATVRMGEVETLEYSQDRGLNLTVYFGQRKGSASSADLSELSLKRSLDQACTIARVTQEDACHGLADVDLMATEQPDLDLWSPWDISPEEAIELATETEAIALAADDRIDNSEGASTASGSAVSLYANSHGFVGQRRSTRHSLSCLVLARDGDSMQRDYWYDTRRHVGDLADAATVGRKAAQRAAARCGARPIATTRAPVLFVPETARTLLGHLVSAISGGNLYRGSSFLRDQLDQQLFPDFVTIEELPLLARGLRSSSFDGEGVACQQRKIVADGVLRGFVLGSYSARKLGLTTTGNAGGVHNLTLRPGARSFDNLIKDMGRGLIVTEMMGQGVSVTTGDYSRGAAGFWVENGEIEHAVEGVTIAGNLKDIFAGVQALGSDLDERAGTRCGSILVGDLTIAGS